MIKRKIAEMMVIYKSSDNSSSKILDWPMLGFQDSEKFKGISNELLPLVIMTIMGQFDIPQIFINEGSSCDILYLLLFEKMGLDWESLIPYDDSDLQEFNGTTNLPWDIWS